MTVKCSNCGHDLQPKAPPEPLPGNLPRANLLAGGWIQGAELRGDGCYHGTANSSLYPLHVSVEEIDWDHWRAENICPGCGGVTQRHAMLTNKRCHLCGGWFDRDRNFTPFPWSWPIPTREDCEVALAKLRLTNPDAVVECGRLCMDHPPFWFEREEERPADALLVALRRGDIVGIDDAPERAWIRRLRDRVAEGTL